MTADPNRFETMPCARCRGTGRVPDPVALGRRLREAREEAGLSLREVARRLGVSSAYLSDVELGRRGGLEEERYRGAL